MPRKKPTIAVAGAPPSNTEEEYPEPAGMEMDTHLHEKPMGALVAFLLVTYKCEEGLDAIALTDAANACDSLKKNIKISILSNKKSN